MEETGKAGQRVSCEAGSERGRTTEAQRAAAAAKSPNKPSIDASPFPLIFKLIRLPSRDWHLLFSTEISRLLSGEINPFALDPFSWRPLCSRFSGLRRLLKVTV